MTEHTLHMTKDGPVKMLSLKAIRDALRLWNPEANAAQAKGVLDVFDVLGYSHVGTSDDPTLLAAATRALEAAGIHAEVDYDTERHDRRRNAAKAAAEGLTPEAVFKAQAEVETPGPNPNPQVEGKAVLPATQTALVLMAQANGNPLQAAAFAANLGRSTGQMDFYAEVMTILTLTFPWLYGMLQDRGFVNA